MHFKVPVSSNCLSRTQKTLNLFWITKEEESENNNKIASASIATPKWTPMKVQQGYKQVLPYLLIM